VTEVATNDGAATPALVWCPFPDADSAADVAQVLIYESLIACANIMPGMRSLYVWKGDHGDEIEVGVLFKTNQAQLSALTARLGELHPYDEPAILGWACDIAAPATAAWLGGLGQPRNAE
jgi:periplasmic divalent cation tolerance protein